MNGRCSSCGKYLELTSDVNGVCAECFNETYSTPETYDDVVKRVLEPYTPTDPITFTYSQIPTETLLMLAERKIKAYEEIIGYLVSTKQVYGSKKKLHSSAYVLSDAINLIWKEMKIHCRNSREI